MAPVPVPPSGPAMEWLLGVSGFKPLLLAWLGLWLVCAIANYLRR